MREHLLFRGMALFLSLLLAIYPVPPAFSQAGDQVAGGSQNSTGTYTPEISVSQQAAQETEEGEKKEEGAEEEEEEESPLSEPSAQPTVRSGKEVCTTTILSASSYNQTCSDSVTGDRTREIRVRNRQFNAQGREIHREAHFYGTDGAKYTRVDTDRTYRTDGKLLTETKQYKTPNGTLVWKKGIRNVYDSAGVLARRHTDFYDANNRRYRENITDNFQRDSQNRLTDFRVRTYTYDANGGNRLLFRIHEVTQRWTRITL